MPTSPLNAEPAWLIEARRHIGMTEIPGPKTNATISGWLHKLRAWWTDDETPWCGVFVAACIDPAGLPLPRYWMRAKAWADWGIRLTAPAPGCIVVFERKGGGHVGFVVGRTERGLLLVLGGNQGNRVGIAAFDPARVVAYVWPKDVPLPVGELTVLGAPGALVSANEA